ncbi:MAG TPA: class I SAM-dependent methyltransferase [Dehalococcoidales bacterium]|nr:class I SAM-dependent methyltransferase [Dehalococcoidales bacterium]
MNEKEDTTGRTEHTYDHIAPAYSSRVEELLADSWIGEHEKGLLDRFLLAVPRSGAGILDIGCGNGKDTDYFRRKAAFAVGMDVSRGMLAEARKRVPWGTFCRMDMRGLGFSTGVFDGVWANGCIYHVPKADLPAVFREVIRVLRPSGVFSFNYKAGAGEGLDDEPRSFGGGPRYYAYYRRGEMKTLLRRAGLRALELESYPGRVFGEEIVQVWAQKP